MRAKCSDCGTRLEYGFYVSKEDLANIREGNDFVPDEVVYCPNPNCGNLAINWDQSYLAFYKTQGVHNERSETDSEKEKK